MKSQSKNITPAEGAFTDKDLERYFSGEMNSAEMHELEAAALENPLLADAMEGFENSPQAVGNLADLKAAFVVPAATTPFWFRKGVYLSAASIAALIVSTIIIFSLIDTKPQEISQQIIETPKELIHESDALLSEEEDEETIEPINEPTDDGFESPSGIAYKKVDRPDKAGDIRKPQFDENRAKAPAAIAADVEEVASEQPVSDEVIDADLAQPRAESAKPVAATNISSRALSQDQVTSQFESKEPYNLDVEIIEDEIESEAEDDVSDTDAETAENVTFIYDVKVIDYRAQYMADEDKNKKTFINGTPSKLANDKLEEKAKALEPDIVPVTYIEYLDEGLRLYTLGKFRRALTQFNFIRNKHPEDLNALFYSGQANYHLKNYEVAILDFDLVLELAPNAFVQETEWYKALTLSHLGYKDDALLLLKQIKANGGFYAEQAQEKLNELLKE